MNGSKTFKLNCSACHPSTPGAGSRRPWQWLRRQPFCNSRLNLRRPKKRRRKNRCANTSCSPSRDLERSCRLCILVLAAQLSLRPRTLAGAKEFEGTEEGGGRSTWVPATEVLHSKEREPPTASGLHCQEDSQNSVGDGDGPSGPKASGVPSQRALLSSWQRRLLQRTLLPSCPPSLLCAIRLPDQTLCARNLTLGGRRNRTT